MQMTAAFTGRFSLSLSIQVYYHETENLFGRDGGGVCVCVGGVCVHGVCVVCGACVYVCLRAAGKDMPQRPDAELRKCTHWKSIHAVVMQKLQLLRLSKYISCSRTHTNPHMHTHTQTHTCIYIQHRCEQLEGGYIYRGRWMSDGYSSLSLYNFHHRQRRTRHLLLFSPPPGGGCHCVILTEASSIVEGTVGGVGWRGV